jgi:hypothetical protein
MTRQVRLNPKAPDSLCAVAKVLSFMSRFEKRADSVTLARNRRQGCERSGRIFMPNTPQSACQPTSSDIRAGGATREDKSGG